MRIQDFRALPDLCVELGRLTILVGRNNAGKTSFMQALAVALGGVRASEDDVHVAEDATRAMRFVIDVKVLPAVGDEFDDAIRGRLASAVQLPSNGPEFFTLRTTGELNADGVNRHFLGGWSCSRTEAATLPVLPYRPRREHLDLLAFFLLDARRDLVEELRVRNSHWGRLVAELGITDEVRGEIEEALRELGDRIVAGSSLLASVREDLQRVTEALGSIVDEVKVAPLPGRIAEVGRAVDVVVGAPGSAALPMRFQGMGTRSLAAVMVFHAFTKTRLGATQDLRPLSIAGFEEPETHLHPQAQRAMFELIASLPGQKIISTHSPYVTRVADLSDLRLFRRAGAAVTCASVSASGSGVPSFSSESLAKVRRFVQRQNGEVFFAQLVVLFEGETEDGALPVFARTRWGTDPSGLCVSLVRVDGAQNLQHFVPILEALQIPWLIFVDGDAEGRDGVGKAGKALGRILDGASLEVVMLPNGDDFEAYLVAEGFRPEIEAAIAEGFGANALENYKKQSQGQPYKDGTPRDYYSAGGQDRLVVDFLRNNKGVSGAAIAEMILRRVDQTGRSALPAKVLDLFQRVDSVLKGCP